MKATELLVNQHRNIEELFERLDRGDPTARGALREVLAKNLLAHTRIEEGIFYPAMKRAMPEEMAMSYEEHALMAVALATLLSTRTNDLLFRPRAAVLEELTSLHIRKEEEDVLKRAESVLGAVELAYLGDQMEVEFNRLMALPYRRLVLGSLAMEMPAVCKTPARRAPAKAARGGAVAKRRVAQAKRGMAAKRGATAKRGMAAKRGATAKRGAQGQKTAKTVGRKATVGRKTTAGRKATQGRKTISKRGAGARAQQMG